MTPERKTMKRTARTTGLVLGALAAGIAPAQAASAAVTASAAVESSSAVPSKTALVRSATTASCTRSMDYGRVTVKVKRTGTEVRFVSVVAPKELPKSAAINSAAVPTLKSRALKAGMRSTKVKKVRTVSGATETSKAFKASLKCALVKVKR